MVFTQKDHFVTGCARFLGALGLTLPFRRLAALLTAHGFMSAAGTPYTGLGRGLPHYVTCLYRKLEAAGRLSDRDAVAAAFVGVSGLVCWS